MSSSSIEEQLASVQKEIDALTASINRSKTRARTLQNSIEAAKKEKKLHGDEARWAKLAPAVGTTVKMGREDQQKIEYDLTLDLVQMASGPVDRVAANAGAVRLRVPMFGVVHSKW